MMATRPLNPKQLAFAREYRVDRNATQAALRAGYSPRTAAGQGWDLLQKPEIKKHIAEGDAKAAVKLEISSEKVLQRLAHFAFKEGIEDNKPRDSIKATELLAKHLGLLNDTVTVKTEITDGERARRVQELLDKGNK